MDEKILLKAVAESTGDKVQRKVSKWMLPISDRTFGTIFGCRDYKNAIGDKTLEDDTYQYQVYTVPADRALVLLFRKGLTIGACR